MMRSTKVRRQGKWVREIDFALCSRITARESHSVWLPGFWVLRIPHRNRKRLILIHPIKTPSQVSLFLCCSGPLALCFRHLTKTVIVGGCIRTPLARLLPLQPSGVRGWTRFSTVILHYLAMCKPGKHIVAVSMSGPMNRASTPMVSCCRMVVGRCSRESGILLISSISTRKHAVELFQDLSREPSRPGRHPLVSTDTRQLYQNCVRALPRACCICNNKIPARLIDGL
ncbi:hypothetical protein GGI43DRAFT_101724 [Trichoderma evansii]